MRAAQLPTAVSKERERKRKVMSRDGKRGVQRDADGGR